MQPVIVTYLEMTSPLELRAKALSDRDFQVAEARRKNWKVNRFFYEYVGAAWCWTDKSNWTEERWREHVESDDLHTFIAYHHGTPVGYFELRRENETVDIAIFGLEPGSTGKGLGGYLLSEALRSAWALSPRRVTANTCTLDHPNALKNYVARGMRIVRAEQRVPGNIAAGLADQALIPSTSRRLPEQGRE